MNVRPKSLALVAAFTALLAPLAAVPPGERVPAIEAGDLERLLSEIKPFRGESPWREIPWLTDVTEARRRSAAGDMPIIVFTAADGSPLGRT